MSSGGQQTIDLSGSNNEVWIVSIPKSVSDVWKSSARNTQVGSVVFERNEEGIRVIKSIELDNFDEPPLFSNRPVLFPTYVYSEHSCYLSIVGRVVGHYQLSTMTDFNGIPSTTKSLRRMEIATEPMKSGDTIIVNLSGRYVDHRGVVDRRIAASDEENLNVLFQAFVGRERCSRKELSDLLQQPESILKSLLSRFCDVTKEKNSNWYSLKPEYRSKFES